jgi:CHAT domain-containing protein
MDGLVRSGLILAGANLQDASRNQGEDGVLTALEVSGLDLRGTKLVVMSACDTGKGDVANGEGVYGLRRAFTLAGAESQLFSLWEVNDWATQALLTRYYDYILAGRGRSDAWRQTQLDMLRGNLEIDPQGVQSITDTAHPNYWAAFVPSGNWEPLKPLEP